MKTNFLPFRRTHLAMITLFGVFWTQPALSATATYYGLDDHIYQYAPDFSSATPVHVNSDAARKSFLTALDHYQYDTVEAPSTTLTFGGSGVTANVANASLQQTNVILPTVGSYAISGIQSLINIGTGNGSPLVFSFNKDVSAFGAYVIQLGDSNAQTLSLQLENTAHPDWLTTVSIPNPVGPYANDPFAVFSGANQDDVFFFGFKDDTHTYNKITLLKSDVVDSEGYLVDDVYVSQVPEPGTIALLLSGLPAGLWLIAARRRRVASA